MLKRLYQDDHNTDSAGTRIADAEFPAPFHEGLEYSSPARGTWNIVHTGMLIPQSHQIFVCAMGCLRGVVLTAAEMNALGRYSSIQIREENVLDGGMEDLMIEGVTDIIHKLDYRPQAILLFISCQHFFLAYDQKLVFTVLRERFPDIRFTDCYMIPTLRKSGLTPDQKMRMQMYSMWEKRPFDAKKVNLIGSNLPTAPTSELRRMVEDAGFSFWDLSRCRDFEDYLAMAEAPLNLIYEPIAFMAAKELKERLGQDYLYLTFTYDFEELEKNYQLLADALGIEKPDFAADRRRAEEAIDHAGAVIGKTPIAVDYTFTFRILNFARMLLEHGFHVTEIYADAFPAEDEADFAWIREQYPDIMIFPTNRPAMRFSASSKDCRKILAVGQKAAYFAATDHFVNVAESGGYYGYDGFVKIMELMEDAFSHKKDRRAVIQRKGYGCESCI
ncbi:MAG: nitrogenase [Clostridiales bacterium]|nr:nitrogenase [Clostridiales bacterium]